MPDGSYCKDELNFKSVINNLIDEKRTNKQNQLRFSFDS